MALGLEGAKPFAIEGAFAAARSLSLVRTIALSLLGIVAVAYSLTAELSLMAATRADNAAQRSQASTLAVAARARYAAAQRELVALPTARPIAVLDAEIKRLRMTPKLASCEDTTARDFGPVSRRVCTEIAALIAEAGTTTRRSELHTIIAIAERDIAAAPLATDADPAATALAVYLAAIGVTSDAGTLSKWLALVPVLALEVGSALAVVLAGTARAHGRNERTGTVPTSRECPVSPCANAKAPKKPDAADLECEATTATPQESSAPSPLSGLARAIVEHLQIHGGRVRKGQRSLAKTFGASTTELHRTIHALAATGVIALHTAPTGTELRLVA